MNAPDDSRDAAIEHEIALAAAPLITAIGAADFYDQLADFLRHRATSDSVVALEYHLHYAPHVLFEDLDPRDGEALYDQYFKGAYLLSPFYLRWLAGREQSALYRLQEIAPDGFFNSIYYTDYYGRSGLIDEMGYVVSAGSESAVLVSLGRTSRHKAYSGVERRRLSAIEPVVASAVKRHGSLLSARLDGTDRAGTRRRAADVARPFIEILCPRTGHFTNYGTRPSAQHLRQTRDFLAS